MSISKEKRIELWETREHICGICGHVIPCIDAMQVDHIIPRSKGGSDADSNLQLTHCSCNNKKSDSLVQAPIEERVASLEIIVQSLCKEITYLKSKIKVSPKKASNEEVFEQLKTCVLEKKVVSLNQIVSMLTSYTKRQIEDAYRACHDSSFQRDDLTLKFTKHEIKVSGLDSVIFHVPELYAYKHSGETPHILYGTGRYKFIESPKFSRFVNEFLIYTGAYTDYTSSEILNIYFSNFFKSLKEGFNADISFREFTAYLVDHEYIEKSCISGESLEFIYRGIRLR